MMALIHFLEFAINNMKTYKLCITVLSSFDEGEDNITNNDIKNSCDGENLDISEIPIIVDGITEPQCKGRSYWMEGHWEIDVEAKSEKQAIETVEQNINWYCDGWTVDSISVHVIS